MKGNIFTRKLANKLMALFSAILILTIFSLSFLSYRIIEKESINNIIGSNQNTLTLINEIIEDYFEEINQASLPHLKYDNIMNALLGATDEMSADAYLEDYIRSLFYSRNDFESICMYLVEQKSYYYISRGTPIHIKVRKVQDSEIPKSEWHDKTLSSVSKTYMQPLFIPSETGYPIEHSNCFFAFHRSVCNIVDKKPYAILTFFCNYKGWDKIKKNITLDGGEKLILLDADNNLFYAVGSEDLNFIKNSRFITAINSVQPMMFDWDIKGKKHLVIYNSSPIKNYRLIKLIPYDKIYRAAQTNRYLSISLGCMILLLSMILVVFSAKAITNPVKKLTEKMQRFSAGKFDLEAKVKGNDEIADLTIQFNKMVKRINDLINEEYKIKLEEKNARLKALEAELNPHFLYNALQAIHTTALKIGAHNICSMVNALAATFRYAISSKNLVTIEDEIKYINDYLLIQNARFGNRLRVMYSIDKQASKVVIPKQSIQLLIENSIKHVLEKEYISLIIYVNVIVMNNDYVFISVKDNGCGIPPEQIEKIRTNIASATGETQSIGLRNLNTRLKLLYKEKAGITIKSDNAGTEISFMIPDGGKVNV
ncbi:MAG TPA: two-component sensor histidine kinase [Clostridiales bacterium]|nr:two-component sensor histidine kinase [Clostridiales bacterium]